jgi:DNA repair exonuclease SbcCD nuclease subunit
MSDIHIGAFRQPELRGLLLDAFEAAVNRCIAERVEFVVMGGDIFDSNIPDLASVRRAAGKIKEAIDSGIRFYAIYGSHDFSPNYSSMVDVLEGAGLFTGAEEMSRAGDRLTLSFVRDPSGPKICGISGRKLSIDRDEYAALDREKLEQEPGFKIFVFHGAIDEMKPSSLEMMQSMPAANLPSGFSYYAGGHVHSRTDASLHGRTNIAYPGPLFATDYTELLEMAKGEQRGFYIVEFDEARVLAKDFVSVKVCDIVEIHYSASGKTSQSAATDLAMLASRSNLTGKVVLLTVDGELSDGKTSDIDFFGIRRRLLTSKPLIVLSNYSHLTSRELPAGKGPPKALQSTERELFEQEAARVKSTVPELRGERGVTTALGLLRTLKEGRKENENKGDFEERTSKAGLDMLDIKEGS